MFFFSTTPTPPYYNEGTRTTLQTSRQSLARGLTAPPVALTLMYPRPIKESGWISLGWRIGPYI